MYYLRWSWGHRSLFRCYILIFLLLTCFIIQKIFILLASITMGTTVVLKEAWCSITCKLSNQWEFLQDLNWKITTWVVWFGLLLWAILRNTRSFPMSSISPMPGLISCPSKTEWILPWHCICHRGYSRKLQGWQAFLQGDHTWTNGERWVRIQTWKHWFGKGNFWEDRLCLFTDDRITEIQIYNTIERWTAVAAKEGKKKKSHCWYHTIISLTGLQHL